MKSKEMNGVYAPETLVMLYQVLDRSFITIVGPDQVPILSGRRMSGSDWRKSYSPPTITA